ncbi:MAG: hypothetical protein K2Q10_14200 [Rhodospirillales bacterium]|nr:hypothetical protein [Rhodospirillales bacterium]
MTGMPYDDVLRLRAAERIDEALEAGRRLAAARPDDGHALHLAGLVHLDAGLAAAAVGLIEQAAAALPGEAALWNSLGVARRQAGDALAAIAAFGRALMLAPRLDAALINTERLLADLAAQAAQAVAPALPARLRRLIVSAADAGYFPLLQGLVLSLRAVGDDDILILDLGLEDPQRRWLVAQRTMLAVPGWDIDFPGRAACPPSFRANVARPFLPRYRPGYDLYLWLDADTWVQDAAALDLLTESAFRHGGAFVAELDRAYRINHDGGRMQASRHALYAQAFGPEVAEVMQALPMINSGAFALAASSPLWREWQGRLVQVLARTPFFFADQMSLNAALWASGHGRALLPATCNWCCQFALPLWDQAQGLFVEPQPPHAAIGILHLTGGQAKAPKIDLPCRDGTRRADSLRYRPRPGA